MVSLIRLPTPPIDTHPLPPRRWPFFFVGFLGMYLETHFSPVASWHLQSCDCQFTNYDSQVQVGHLGLHVSQVAGWNMGLSVRQARMYICEPCLLQQAT